MQKQITCNIQLTGFNNTILLQAVEQLKSELKEKKFTQLKTYSLPKRRKRFTVLNSPHVHKKAREQFELKIYKYQVTFINNKVEVKEILNFFREECLKDFGYSISLKR